MLMNGCRSVAGSMSKIGVLALQGAVGEHMNQIKLLDREAVEVKTSNDLCGIDGLILPGGESTAIGKLIERNDLLAPIQALAQQGIPMFGTCAGLILLAKRLRVPLPLTFV